MMIAPVRWCKMACAAPAHPFCPPAEMRVSPSATHRLFFAAWPDAPTRRRLAALTDQLASTYRARWLRPTRYHLTLCFLGNHAPFPHDLAERALQAATGLRLPALVWRIDQVIGFRARRPPCVAASRTPNLSLQRLQASLCRALDEAGVPQTDGRPYMPHVTLGYGQRRRIVDTAVDPVDFSLCEFVLLHSMTGESAYRELGRWPLNN
jgi:2'-5' RNA ligase